MSAKLIARTAKLLTDTKKGRRKGVAITYEHIPKDIEERNHGSIYAVIHVNAPADEAQEITELIIDAFHGEYYQDLNREPLLSFEAALSKINEELAEATHQGNISWLNNLNAVLGVLTGNTLHITKAGKTEAYLYRGEKQSHISNELSGDVVNPLRTFINIASGEIFEGDKVAITTPGTFYHLSKNELQKYVQAYQPRVAINHLADILEGTAGEVNPNAILILEAITPEAASNETIEEEPDEVWISEQPQPLKSAIDNTTPVVAKIFGFFRLAILGVVAFTGDIILPAIAKIIPKANELIKKPKTDVPEENILTDTEESLEVPGDADLDDLALKESSEVIGQKVEPSKQRANEIFIKEENQKPKWLKLEKANFSYLSNLSAKIKRFSRKFFAHKRNLAILAIVLAVIFAGGIYLAYQDKNPTTVKVAEASLSEAQGRFEAGQSALDQGDKKKAAGILREAEQIASSLVSDKEVGDRANKLLVSIKEALDEAEGVTRINPAVFADTKSIVGENAFGPYQIGNFLYLVNPSNGSIAEIAIKTGEVSAVLDNPDKGRILAATVVPKRSILVLANESGSIFEFDTKDPNLKEMDITGDVEKIMAMTSFSTNIYTLTKEGKIYKRLKTSTGYGKRVEYITDNSNVAGSVSIATDSSMFALAPNSGVKKYLAGKLQNYSLSLPITINTANYLFTNENTVGLYITDKEGKRVVKVNSQGGLDKQYVSDNFSNITGVSVSGKTIYVLAGGKVYKVSS